MNGGSLADVIAAFCVTAGRLIAASLATGAAAA
jgi:hypothetical protein